MAIGVAVVVLRCYPPLARELARIAGLSRGVVAFVGLARATRTPPGSVLPSFALVLVLAMVAFPDMISHVGDPGPGGRILAAGGRRRHHRRSSHPSRGFPWRCSSRSLRCQASWPPLPRRPKPGRCPPGPRCPWCTSTRPGTRPWSTRRPARGSRWPRCRGTGDGLPAVANAAAAQLVGTAPTEVGVGSQHHHDPAGRTDRQRPRRDHGRRRAWCRRSRSAPARSGESHAGRRTAAGWGAAERGRPPRRCRTRR